MLTLLVLTASGQQVTFFVAPNLFFSFDRSLWLWDKLAVTNLIVFIRCHENDTSKTPRLQMNSVFRGADALNLTVGHASESELRFCDRTGGNFHVKNP